MLLTQCVSGIDDIGRFSEHGRGVPVALSRPGAALPSSPLVRQAYAPRPLTHLGWGQGLITVADVTLEPSSCALSPSDTVAAAAALCCAAKPITYPFVTVAASSAPCS